MMGTNIYLKQTKIMFVLGKKYNRRFTPIELYSKLLVTDLYGEPHSDANSNLHWYKTT